MVHKKKYNLRLETKGRTDEIICGKKSLCDSATLREIK